MLEVKNICKTYRPKKGAETKALDDVSVAFPEKGMVFLLGKSGSGKSTLLNICGGLDKADSGEIVIKGRSSKDFTPTDFDSYRNTLVGFVFQEYNILYEFSVEDNIALSLELQNKKRDQQKIDKILESIDLKEFAKRKPNTLSGGQKQRVAIARALVKEPQIILADEPTGALDSATGRQVLDTLKKLSSDRLVIVVSHDREFAENYADRIIELKDGKIVSDRTREGDSALLKNVQFIGNDAVAVRDGSALTDEDMAAIRQFLSAAKGGAVLRTDGEAVQQAKNAAPNEITGVFEPTRGQPETRAYSAEEQTFIRSRMPFRHAFRMGANSIRIKPVRLAFTIFLCFVAFVTFGMFSTVMFYNSRSMTVKTLEESDLRFVRYEKAYQATYKEYETFNGVTTEIDSYETTQFTPMTDNEISALQKKYPGSIAGVNTGFAITGLELKDERFYNSSFQGFAFCSENAAVNILAGRKPQNAGEAMISDYTFASMQFGDLQDDDGHNIELENYNDFTKIPEQAPFFTDQTVKIVGVYEAEKVPEIYLPVRDASLSQRPTDSDNELERLITDWEYENRNGFYSYLLMHESMSPAYFDYVQAVREEEENRPPEEMDIYSLFLQSYTESNIFVGENSTFNNIEYFNTYDNANGRPLLDLFDLSGKTLNTVGAGEIAISVADYGNLLYYNLKDLASLRYDELLEKGETEKAQALWDEYLGPFSSSSINDAIDILYRVPSTSDRQEVFDALGQIDDFLKRYDITLPLTLSNDELFLDETVRLAGVFISDETGFFYLGKDLFNKFYRGHDAFVTEKYETKYVQSENAYLELIFIPQSAYRQDIKALVDSIFTVNDDDSTASISNAIVDEILKVNITMFGVKIISLGIGFGFTLFAVLLMFNFISASITAKKQEIGILRAIGARSTDIFKIFWSESLIIAAACLVLSVIACVVLCPVINMAIISNTSLRVSLLVFSPVSFLFMAAVALITATISTLLPVAVYSKKPPIESIRAL